MNPLFAERLKQMRAAAPDNALDIGKARRRRRRDVRRAGDGSKFDVVQ